MAEHIFELRTAFKYSGDDNKIENLEAEVLAESGWRPLQIDNHAPGFLIFVYSFLVCQHTYFHANSSENGLMLERARLELLMCTDDDWKINKVKVDISAELRSGSADSSSVDYIKKRMRQCPVSINLKEPRDYQIELEFG